MNKIEGPIFRPTQSIEEVAEDEWDLDDAAE